MFDMIALAFQTDQTRVSSYMMPSQSVLSSMGITIPVHALSHYNISEERTVNAGYRDKKCTELFGYLLDRLKEKKDVSGQSIYDSCIVSYGTNIDPRTASKASRCSFPEAASRTCDLVKASCCPRTRPWPTSG